MPEPFPWSNWTLSYDLKLEEIALADRLGYDEIWVGEHHTGAYENIPAPDIFIAKASALTHRIGLGTGTLAVYGAPGDEFQFYEINPQVIEIARSQFTFLGDSKAKIEIAEGDARLSLEREAPHHFNVLVVDAFSGDAIPVHLLTKEAFAVYLRHLDPGGVIAFHVSNQFLDLAPEVRRIALEYGFDAVEVKSDRDEDRGLASATWVLVTKNRELLARSEIARVAVPIAAREVRLWTDDYNNLLQLIR